MTFDAGVYRMKVPRKLYPKVSAALGKAAGLHEATIETLLHQIERDISMFINLGELPPKCTMKGHVDEYGSVYWVAQYGAQIGFCIVPEAKSIILVGVAVDYAD